MTGYSSNQFYNFGVTYEKGKSLARTNEDNPNFIYPRPIQPDIYNPIRGKQPVDTRLQRGFIRGIYPSVLGGKTIQSGSNIKQRRLFFQFNPETIDRSVEMNAMIANPLLQDPAQIFQPVAGTAAFSFRLLFNREAEVVSARTAGNNIRNGSWLTDTASPLTGSLNDYGTNFKRSDVANLGVLADLYVLDSIIGQGITPDMVDFLRDYFTTASNATQNYNSTVGGPSAATFDSTGFDTNITKNFGNSAFLSPLPIRIVFSSLFMVEGFVESSSVQFVKFTKDYVPTVCSVNLTLRALYIGFAKEEAYLTSALKVSVTEQRAAQVQEDLAIARARRYATNGIAFSYTTPTFEKSYAGDPGLPSSVWDFDTVQNWWNAKKRPGGSLPPSAPTLSLVSERGGAGRGSGDVTSWVSPAFAKEVTDGTMSWTLSSSIKFEEIDASSKTIVKVLYEGPFKYFKHSVSDAFRDSEVVEFANIAENAVKAKTKESARKNKWGISIEQTGLPTMDSATSLLRLTITNLITITVLSNGSSVSVPTTVYDSVDIAARVGELGDTPANSLITATTGGLYLEVGKVGGFGQRTGGPS
jgi:hypothetical protein